MSSLSRTIDFAFDSSEQVTFSGCASGCRPLLYQHAVCIPDAALCDQPVGLAVLTQRIQRMQASQEESKWPGYQQWRESNESPWCGFGEWRTTDKNEDQRRSSILRHRMSKPGLAAEEDVVEAVDHLDRLEKLDLWHKTCWNNFRDSDAFGR
ncbi:hypothetical protein WJX82_001936 [Trebouxia sp. C0006]